MKTKFLLGIIPALLALSACNGGAQIEKEKLGDDLLEDTLAHEEIFGSAEEGLSPKRLLRQNPGILRFDDPTPVTEEEESGTPYIGVQSILDGSTLSLRFVAAVTFASDNQREYTNAQWTRTVSKADASVYPKDTTDPVPACTTAYKKLSNGGSALTIEDFNTAHSSSYTHFVVYTLRNIDLTKYAATDYYVSAYLTLSKATESGLSQVSKAIAISFDRQQKFVYYPTVETNAAAGAYFITGSIKGQSKLINATAVRPDGNDGDDLDKAQFRFIDFDEDDTFYVKEFYNTKLYVHGYNDCLYNGGSPLFTTYYGSGDNDSIRVLKSGNYGVYLHQNNKFGMDPNDPYDQLTGFYVRGTFNSWTDRESEALYSDRTENKGASHKIHMEANDEFKVYKKDGYGSGYDLWAGWHGGYVCADDNGVADENKYFVDAGGNIKCQITGYYYVFLNGSNEVWVSPTTAPAA